jgi:hypothetical protein
MGRTARAGAGLFIVLAALTAMSTHTGAAFAAGVRCEEKVLTDWSDNGRVDGMYSLHCYQDAIEKMPTDLRDYTNATEAIHRALARAVSTNSTNGGTPQVAAGADSELAAGGSSSVPLPLLVLAAISVVVLLAGGVGYLSRRRREAG